MKQIPYSVPTNIRRQHKKRSRPGHLAPGCVHACYGVREPSTLFARTAMQYCIRGETIHSYRQQLRRVQKYFQYVQGLLGRCRSVLLQCIRNEVTTSGEKWSIKSRRMQVSCAINPPVAAALTRNSTGGTLCM
jgi:hypothetical protein